MGKVHLLLFGYQIKKPYWLVIFQYTKHLRIYLSTEVQCAVIWIQLYKGLYYFTGRTVDGGIVIGMRFNIKYECININRSDSNGSKPT